MVLVEGKGPAGASVEGAVIVVGAGAGEGGTGLAPGQRARGVGGGEAERARALQPVLQPPAEERRLLGDFAGLGVLVIVVEGQADHGVGLGEVPTKGGTLGGLNRESMRVMFSSKEADVRIHLFGQKSKAGSNLIPFNPTVTVTD